MAFFDERDGDDGLTVRVYLSLRDIKLAMAGNLSVRHENEDAEQAGEVAEVIVHIADV